LCQFLFNFVKKELLFNDHNRQTVSDASHPSTQAWLQSQSDTNPSNSQHLKPDKPYKQAARTLPPVGPATDYPNLLKLTALIQTEHEPGLQ
jgi:hypothetical protein